MKHIYSITIALIISLHIPVQAHSKDIPDEVKTTAYLHEVIHHLYRWYLDEHDIENALPAPTIEIWLQDVTPEDLDPGDNSQILKMGLPVFNLRIMLKKTDYHIPELDLKVQSQNFKIIKVAREPTGTPAPEHAWTTELCVKATRDHLFQTRGQADPLDPALGKHVRAAVMRQIAMDDDTRDKPIHEVHIAPLSPVANELWIFWETGRRLIRVASDIELTNPAMWEHERLAVRLFNIDRQTVVSLAEKPGSNAYLTRDQVGRALYNCIVLGEHREIKAE